MPPLTIWKVLSNNLGFAGLFAGLLSGFLIRDEYNFPTVKKMDDLLLHYEENSLKIKQSRETAQDMLKAIEVKEIAEKELENSKKTA